jgi:hypothetical protein
MTHRTMHLSLAAVAALALAAVPPAPAHAAEPSGATIDKRQDAEWSGSFVASNPLPVACSDSADPTCDYFALTVDARPGTNVAVAITTDDPNAMDLDLLVYAPNGELVKTSTTATATESLVFEVDPEAHGTGAYEVRVQPWTVLPGATYTGVAMVTRDPIEGGVGVFPLDECSDLTGPDSFSLDLGDNILLEVMVLLDGVARERADDVMRVAANSYAPLNVSLKWRFREVAYATDEANELISLAKHEFKGVRPKGFDIVYVMTTKDIQIGGETAVAGLADCISGVSFDDHAFAVGEDFGVEEDDGRALGPFTHTVDGSAIVVAHEIGHLMGAHHHYGNCIEGNSLENVEDLELTPCTLMFNAVNFGSLPFGTLNTAVVRGHASDFARP